MKTLQLLAVLVALEAFLPVLPAFGQTTTAIHRFDSSATGELPNGLVAGNGVLYGTTQGGGSSSYGTVFELRPPASPGGTWTETILHNFNPQTGDGVLPYAVPVVGPDGVLYGTTGYGGANCGGSPPGCGTVYELQPPATPGDAWTETVLYSFTYEIGWGPQSTPILCTNQSICDDGALYGTTASGGAYNAGTVFELKPPTTPGGTWTETVLYSFAGGSDGDGPMGLAMDGHGALYGVTLSGGHGPLAAGTVFQLTPPATPGGASTEKVLHRFQGGADGSVPYAPPVIASDGTLYGTTGGCYNFCVFQFGDAQVFALKPPASPDGHWTKELLRAFQPDWGLESPLVFRDGVIYEGLGSFAGGELFKLDRQADGAWVKTILHSFGHNVVPAGNFVIDQRGTIFGVTYPVSVNGYAYTSWAYSLTP